MPAAPPRRDDGRRAGPAGGGNARRRPWLAARVAISAALVVCAGVITPAGALAATTTTISFDDLSPGTTVSTQYDAQGVDFATGIVGSNVYCHPVIKAVASGQAQSGTQVADASCANGEFPDSSIRGDLSDSAENVSVYAGFSPTATPPSTVAVTLTAYDVSGAVVDTATQTVTAGAGTHTLLAVSSGSPNIVAFDVTSTQPDVSIDDLTFDNPSGVPADFSLDPQTSVVYPVQGSSTTDMMVIHRLNGSNGAITFSASDLPTGVHATFSPNPVTGTAASTTMTLSADGTAPPFTSGVYPVITITGTPADAGVGSTPRTAGVAVDVTQLFTVNGPSTVNVPPCSTLQIPVTVTAAAGFSGTVALTANNVPADDQASFSPATLTEPGQTHTTLTLTSQSDLSGAAGAVSITVSGGGVSDTSGTFAVSRVAPSITDITDSSNHPLTGGQTPQGASPDLGTVVVVHGQGFCPGSTVYFGNQLATSVQQGPFTDGLGPDGDETAIRTSVPALATTGKVYVVAPHGTLLTPGTATAPFTIDSYRDTDGFSFENNGPFQDKVGGYSFSDVSDVFGYDQTHASVNPCWPLGDCSISTPIPNPLALIFWGIANEALRDGQCFGFSLASQRLLHGDQILPAFPSQPGATAEDVWNLQGPDSSSGPSSTLMHYIHLIHMEQWSSEGLNAWLVGTLENSFAGSESFIMEEVTEALDAGDHPLIELREGASGHVLVAYGVDQDSGNTDYRSGDGVIDVYNPNLEFTTAENAITGTAHQQALANSEIIVHPNGSWQFQGFSPEWHGGGGSLVVIPYGTIPVHPTLPATITGLLDVLFGGAQATQVTDAKGHTLLNAAGALNTNPKTAIPDATQAATFSDSNTSTPGPDIFLFGHDGGYTTTVAGTSSGMYHDVLFSHGTSASLTAAATRSTKDAISVPADMDGLAFGQTAGSAAARAATVQLVQHASDGSTRTATIATTVPTKGTASTMFDRAHNAVEVAAGGRPTSYALTLSWLGPHGFPQTFVAPTVDVSAGGHASFAPSDWSALGTSTLTVRIVDAHGHVTTRTLRNRLHPLGRYAVALKVVKAGRARRLTIATRFAHVVPGSSAVLTWMVLEGRKLAARHTLVIPAAKLHRGLLTRSFSFTPRKAARYALRASVELLTPEPGGSYTSRGVTRTTRLRG